MSFWGTVTRQFKGAVNDVAESMEDPGRTARQIVRDIDGQIHQAEDALTDVMAEVNILTRKKVSALELVAMWHGRAVKAAQAGNDPLAEKALAEEDQAQKVADGYAKQLDALQPTVASLKASLQQLTEKKDELARRTDVIEARSHVAQAQSAAATALSGIGSGNDAASAFGRLEERVEREEGAAAAKTELANERNGHNLDAEFAALDAKPAMSDRLAALKQENGIA